MDWNQLLSSKRLGKNETNLDNPSDPRSVFTRDYDRIIFSSAFRRLQDKTQVFPLAKSDYVRTRLTHSLEVASVGRSLGVLAADVILHRDISLRGRLSPHDVGSIVATACLAHDIGNPPFGHAGESAIQEWFQSELHPGFGSISGSERQDLLKFEGNAQGFRTLCSLQQKSKIGGMQLSCAVLGAFTKYPRESQVDESQQAGISGKKFGFMQSEEILFNDLANELGLIKKSGSANAWHRHPLAFLVEAADDICYHVMDIEDGFKGRYVSYEEIFFLHRPWLTNRALQEAEKIQDKDHRVEYFRAVTVNEMIREAVDVFRLNLDALTSGDVDQELSVQLPRAAEFKAFKELAKKQVYSARPVVEIEACGFEVIGGLMTAFADAIGVKAAGAEKGKERSRTLLSLMPSGVEQVVSMSPYQRALLVTDFISGMTDSFAVELYQRIRGISLP